MKRPLRGVALSLLLVAPWGGAVADEPAEQLVTEAPATDTPEPNPTIEPHTPEHDGFTLYAADPGALTWDDLTPAERAAAERAMEWSETQNGAAVHSAYSASVQQAKDAAAVEDAIRMAGLEGHETLGVTP